MKHTSQFEKVREDLLPIQSYLRDFRSQITDKKEEKFAFTVEVLIDSLCREIKDFVSEQNSKN
jgi:hypothetical protein